MIRRIAIAALLCLAVALPVRAWLVLPSNGGGTPPPPNGNPLLGVEMDPPDNPVFSSYMGRYPDATIDGSYLYIDGTGNNPCSSNYPLIIAVPHFGYQGGGGPWNDPNASANGSYNSQYDNFWQQQVGPCASQIYAARVDWEWDGNWYNFSPYGYNCLNCSFTERISPATWTQGFQQFVTRMRAYAPTANIKVEWDYPMSSESGAVSSDPNILNYYPGDAYVDIVGADVYFNPQYQGSGGGSVGWNAWNSGQGLQQWAAFAAAHHKAMGAGEWCDMYYDGYNIAQFAAFIAQNPFVFHDYWDTDDGGAPCRLQEHGTNQNAYISAFGVHSSQYPANGSYWGGLKALPGNKPAGF